MEANYIKTISVQFDNGDTILAYNGDAPNRVFFVKVKGKVLELSEPEINEKYGKAPNCHLVSIEID